MQKHRKFIGDKRFYLMVLGVAMPIMIQNGITNFVSLLDNIMVGQVGTEQMSGVAIVNQLLFIYNLCIFGGVSGAGIFTAQYFGQGNDEGVRNIEPLSEQHRRTLHLPYRHRLKLPMPPVPTPCPLHVWL